MEQYIALDIGATQIRCVVADADRQFVARRTQQTPQETTAAGFADTVGRVVDTTRAAAGIPASAIEAVCIASFGPLDTTAGTIIMTPNLASDLRDIPVREAVADRVPDSVPVALINDAVAGAIAEHQLGGDEANVVYLTLSSGIGAGVVVDGSVLRGRHGNAAEVGHMSLTPGSNRQCGCGGYGHWEAFASGEQLPRYAREIATDRAVTTELSLAENELSAEQLFDRYGADPLATETIDRVGEWNTLGLANIVHAFAPDRVAIGGSVALYNPTLVFEPISRSLAAHLTVDTPAVHLTEFGADVVTLGAVQHAMTQ
jgi:Transcriptional regulator/sugar kinase